MECRKKGIRKFIGDVLVEEATKGLNCDVIVIDSNEESISLAIREAESVLEATRQQIIKNHEIQTVIDSVRDGVICTDKCGNIKFMNKSAIKMFEGLLVRNNIAELIENEIPAVKSKCGQIYTINSINYIVNIVPVFNGDNYIETVYSFQLCDEISQLEHRMRRKMDKNGFVAKYTFENIIHTSRIIDEIIEKAKKFAAVDAPILINGKSGTGKELICQSIHNSSKRKAGPFIAVNCAAISPSLIESEFFGYDAGAFTGAKKSGKAGIFELAHNGTLFLDETSELPMDLQGRLLRVLQEKQVMRLGGDKVIPVDVRIVCASNRELKELVNNGEFRVDLYYRIGILKLNIPSLAERREDIINLAEYFLDLYSSKYKTEKLKLDNMVRENLVNREYEGNVRELEGLIEESTVLGSFENIFDGSEKKKIYCNQSGTANESLEEHSRKYIYDIYEQTGKNIKLTCDILGISRSTLWRKLNDILN